MSFTIVRFVLFRGREAYKYCRERIRRNVYKTFNFRNARARNKQKKKSKNKKQKKHTHTHTHVSTLFSVQYHFLVLPRVATAADQTTASLTCDWAGCVVPVTFVCVVPLLLILRMYLWNAPCTSTLAKQNNTDTHRPCFRDTRDYYTTSSDGATAYVRGRENGTF